MTHLTDEEMLALPEDSDEGFIAGEKIMRERLSKYLDEHSGDTSTNFLTQDYMNNVIALAVHFGIVEIAPWHNAKPGQHGWMEYQRFVAEVDACTMRKRLQRARRVREYSVALNAATKKKLRHLLDQMRETVDKLEISITKKDKLFKRISALQDEIDRDRTGFQTYGALAIEIADEAGETATRLEPVTRMIERLGAALGLAKRNEEPQAQLPPPSKPKQIEGPKAGRKSGFNRRLDDEIPF